MPSSGSEVQAGSKAGGRDELRVLFSGVIEHTPRSI